MFEEMKEELRDILDVPEGERLNIMEAQLQLLFR